MKRRSFMGLVGALVGTGPKGVAKAVAPIGMDALSLAGIATIDNGESNAIPSRDTNAEWAKEQIEKLIGMSASQERQAIKNYYMTGLDPDTQSLRSVSLGMKMEISRRRQYAQWKRNRKPYLQGVISGHWDY